MRPKDLLERAHRLAARKNPDLLVGKATLFYPDAEDGNFWREVELADYPPGPERDAILEAAFHLPGDPTHDDWVMIWEKEDEEAKKNATA